MPRFATKQHGVKVKVEHLTVNDLLSKFLFKLNQFSREARLTCPSLRPKEDIYIGIVTSFQRVVHLAKKYVNAPTFRTICGETKMTRKKLFGYF